MFSSFCSDDALCFNTPLAFAWNIDCTKKAEKIPMPIAISCLTCIAVIKPHAMMPITADLVSPMLYNSTPVYIEPH